MPCKFFNNFFRFIKIFIFSPYCKNAKNPRLGSYRPTHVVSAITYGGNAHIEFENVNNSSKIFLKNHCCSLENLCRL